jgi:rhodanese-related sulfurtransferase
MIDEIDVHQLKKLLENYNGKDSLIFDCREQDEWDQGHLAKINLIPLSQLEARFEELKPFTDLPIYIHCRSGKRSMNACLFLQSQGFSELYNVEGGILAWNEAGYPIIQK